MDSPKPLLKVTPNLVRAQHSHQLMDNPNQSNTPNHPKKDVFQRFLHEKKKTRCLCPRSHLGPLRSIQRSSFRAPRCANAQPGYIAAREAIGPSCAAQRGPFSMAQLGDCPGFLWEFTVFNQLFQQIPWVFRCCPISCTQKVLKPTHFEV